MSTDNTAPGWEGTGAGVWQLAAEASDKCGELMDDIPGGGDGFQLAAESGSELYQAAELLDKAATLLEQVREREVPRYELWTEDAGGGPPN